MNFEVVATELFIRELKRLSKKYPAVKQDCKQKAYVFYVKSSCAYVVNNYEKPKRKAPKKAIAETETFVAEPEISTEKPTVKKPGKLKSGS